MFSRLALGGGGTKGFLHLGALQELEYKFGNLTSHFKDGIYGCSIGSLIATGVAFGLNTDQIIRMSKKYIIMKQITGNFQFNSISSIVAKKGMFNMNLFETQVLKAFDSEGIDLRNKFLSDAKIPLNISASNVTKGIPTIFRGKVLVIDCLKASCCLPFIFNPQQIGNSLYVDGGFMTNVILKVIPQEHRDSTLAICIIQPHHHITPSNILTLTPVEYIYRLYKTLCMYEHSVFKNSSNIVSLFHTEKPGYEDPSPEIIEDMILTGRCLMRDFLRTKRTNQESIKR